jgi:hypothetical protein
MTALALVGYAVCLIGLVLFVYELDRQMNSIDDERGEDS